MLCLYYEHPLAGRDIQYRAPDSWSRYTTPYNDQLITYYLCVHYLLRIQYPVNTTYNSANHG